MASHSSTAAACPQSCDLGEPRRRKNYPALHEIDHIHVLFRRPAQMSHAMSTWYAGTCPTTLAAPQKKSIYERPTSLAVPLRLVCRPSCLCLRRGRKLSEERTGEVFEAASRKEVSFARRGRFRGEVRYLITLQHGASSPWMIKQS
jgi:hypothetical protein